MALSLPTLDAEIVLVDTEDKLQQHSDIWERTSICGLDAEWQPNSRIPKATLVQLALKTSSRTLILLLDILALPQQSAKAFLQSLFRSPSVLKVGYGITGDLKAISEALGSLGGSCIAVVMPVVDLRVLMRQLRTEYEGVLPKSKGPGLSGLAHSLLGKALDKKQQCSPWEARPLTQQQVEYAALDAGCLLGILEACIRICKPNTRGASSCSPGDSPVDVSASSRDTQIADQDSDFVQKCMENATPSRRASQTPGSEGVRVILEHQGPSQIASIAAGTAGELCGTDGGEAPHLGGYDAEIGGAGLVEQLNALTVSRGHNCVGGGLTDGDIGAASETWGCRLETVGGFCTLMGRDGRRLEAASSNAKETHCKGNYFPAVIPWEDAESLTPRFVADVPLEGLARQLRLCGIDTLSSPTFSKADRYKAYRYMLGVAAEDGRVILTCDTLFFARRLSNQAFFVGGKDKKAQLAEVMAAFGLKGEEAHLLSRCSRCNGEFLPRSFGLLDLPAATARQMAKLRAADHASTRFWVCQACSHAYWQGSQFKRCVENLSDRLSAGGSALINANPSGEPIAQP